MGFAWKMFCQGLTPGLVTWWPLSPSSRSGRSLFGFGRLQFFQLQLQLLHLMSDLLALLAKHHSTKLGNDQLEMFDLTGVAEQLLSLIQCQGQQRFAIQLAQIGCFICGSHHGKEYATCTSQ